MIRESLSCTELRHETPNLDVVTRIHGAKEGTRIDLYSPLAKVDRDRHLGRKEESNTPPRRPKEGESPSPKSRPDRTERPPQNPRRRGK